MLFLSSRGAGLSKLLAITLFSLFLCNSSGKSHHDFLFRLTAVFFLTEQNIAGQENRTINCLLCFDVEYLNLHPHALSSHSEQGMKCCIH